MGETVIGYSNNPFCVKFLYKGIIGFTVRWNNFESCGTTAQLS